MSAGVATSAALASVVADERGRRHLTPAMLRWWGRTMLRLVRVRVEVEGAQHLAGDGPRVVTFNHSSMLDAFVVTSLMPDASTAAVKIEATRWPVLGQAMRTIGFVIIDRGHSEVARAAMRRASERMRDEGLAVFIAPEGTRTRTGELLPFRRGAMHLAVDAHAPVVPVVIAGAFALQPRGSFAIAPGTLRVRVLPPIEPTWTHETAGAATDALRATYEAVLESL